MDKFENNPLVKDLKSAFSNFSSENCKNLCLEKYRKLLINYESGGELTDDDIYKYIHFIDFSCENVEEYKNVVKFINKNNFNHIYKLFDNINIRNNLLPLITDSEILKLFFDNYISKGNYLKLLPYDIIILYYNYEIIKEEWLEHNFDWVYKNMKELLTIYNEYVYEYYKINGKIKSNITFYDDKIIDDYLNLGSDGEFEIVKYLYENYLKHVLEDTFVFSNCSCGENDGSYYYYTCEHVEYPNKHFINNFIISSIIANNYSSKTYKINNNDFDLIIYLLEQGTILYCDNYIIMKFAIGSNNIKAVKYLSKLKFFKNRNYLIGDEYIQKYYGMLVN